MFNFRGGCNVCKKRKGTHTEWGEVYHASYVVVFITAIILSILHWNEIAYLFYVALFLIHLLFMAILQEKDVGKIGFTIILEVC